MSTRPTILLADYDGGRLARHERALAQAGFAVTTAADGTAALEACASATPDLVILEVLLPRKNGFVVLKTLKEEAATGGIRVLVLLDQGDSYGTHRAQLCGADRILSRPFTAEQLVEAARDALDAPEARAAEGVPTPLAAVLEAMEGRARAENPLNQHITDPLTGLHNRPYLELKLADEFKKARRFQIPLTCLVLGLEDGGSLSDPEAAPGFRRVLNEVAGLLLCESRDIDILARYGSRELLALLPHTDGAGAASMAARLMAAIEERALELPGGRGPVQAAVGIATYAGVDVESGEDLVQRALEAMSRSLRQGRFRITSWSADMEKSPR